MVDGLSLTKQCSGLGVVLLLDGRIHAKQEGISPCLHRGDEWSQRLAGCGERVLHSGRHYSVDLPDNDTVVFQLSQLGGKDARAESRLQLLKLIEAKGPVVDEVMEDKALPLASDDFETRFHPATGIQLVVRVTAFSHGHYPKCKYVSFM